MFDEQISNWDWVQWWSLFMFMLFFNSLAGPVFKGERNYTVLLGFLILLGPLFLRVWNFI